MGYQSSKAAYEGAITTRGVLFKGVSDSRGLSRFEILHFKKLPGDRGVALAPQFE